MPSMLAGGSMRRTSNRQTSKASTRGLTLRQQRFCVQWFRHKGIGRRAYMHVYGVKSPNVADASASRLLSNAKVRPVIERLKQAMAKRAEDITLDSLVNDLDEIRRA